MARTQSRPPAVLKKPRKFSLLRRLKEISMFFAENDEVHKTMRRLARRLERVGIAYAIMGGMAVNAHKHRRTTADVDFLLTRDGFNRFKQFFVPKNYSMVGGRPRRFIDKANAIEVDFLLTGLYPGSGKRGPIAFPEPTEVSERINRLRFVDLVTLIQLKLAARRYQDFGDVVKLIEAQNLDESFAERLHPSVRRDYIECLDEKLREDEYNARDD
jgi:hypothetical protein